MIKTNIQNFSIEKIVENIKQEVNKRKKRLIFTLDTNHIDTGIFKNISEPFLEKDVYTYHDFTKYHDEDFIQNCYKGLLKREVDTAGFQYHLSLLRSGKKSKAELVTILRYSKEGKSKNVHLLGSKKRYILTILSNIPIFGICYKWLIAFITLPRIIQRLNAYEHFSYQLYTESYKNEQKLLELINTKGEKISIQNILNDISAFIQTKADKTDLNIFENQLNKKADKTDFNAFKNELNIFENQLNEKADKTDFNAFKNELNIFENQLNKIVKKETHLTIPELQKFTADNYLAKAIQLSKHNIMENTKDINSLYYSLFEDIFYESKNVKEKQKNYLSFLGNKTKEQLHLDVGCGRGEFLELLKENNYNYYAIDINQAEIDRLKELNFNVELNDINSYLNHKDMKNQFSSISALQVIEHLSISEMKTFLKNSFTALKQNGVLILETVNPHTPFSFGGFYMDETHNKPIPPEQLCFIMQWYGFKDLEIVYSSPLPKEYTTVEAKRNYYDYAIIGYKR